MYRLLNILPRLSLPLAVAWSVCAQAQSTPAYRDSVRLYVATELQDRYILSDSTEAYTFELLLDDPTLSSWAATVGLGLGYTERQLLLSAHANGYVEPFNRWRLYFHGEVAPSISLAEPLISNPQLQRSTHANADVAFSLFKRDDTRYAAMLLSDRHTRVKGKHVIHFSDFRRIQNLNVLLGLGVHQRASDPRADTLQVQDPTSGEEVVLKPGNYSMQVVRFGVEWQEKSTTIIKVNNVLRPTLLDLRAYAQVLMAVNYGMDVSHFRYRGTELDVVPTTFETQPFDFQRYGFLLGLQTFTLNKENPGRRHSVRFELGVLPGVARPGGVNNFFVHLHLGFWGFGNNLKEKVNRKYPEVDW